MSKTTEEREVSTDNEIMSYISVLVSLVAVVVCFIYLLPSSGPRPWWKRVLCFVGLAAIFLLPVLRSTVRWSLSYPHRGGWESVVSLLAFLGLIIGFWVLGRDGWLDMVGRTASVLLLAVVVLSKRISIVLLGAALGGVMTGTYLSGARLDATHSYELYDAQSLIGGAHFERCVVYENPRWFPLVRREISHSPLDSPKAGDEYAARVRNIEYERRGIRLRSTR